MPVWLGQYLQADSLLHVCSVMYLPFWGVLVEARTSWSDRFKRVKANGFWNVWNIFHSLKMDFYFSYE